jgi:hypothetical protein
VTPKSSVPATDPAADLILRIEAETPDPVMAARRLREAALALLREVNHLERMHPENFLDFRGREWHIARYEKAD